MIFIAQTKRTTTKKKKYTAKVKIRTQAHGVMRECALHGQPYKLHRFLNKRVRTEEYIKKTKNQTKSLFPRTLNLVK